MADLADPGFERFPAPEFPSGYVIPEAHLPDGPWPWMETVDLIALVAALAAATYLAHRARSRTGLLALSATSLAYFGFVREGCICPVGALQNVVLALSDRFYEIPAVVALLFLAPLAVAALFGRSFCAAVCPLGAIQEMVSVRPVRVPDWLDRPLRLLPYVYLGLVVLLASTGGAFLICRFDPFVSFFRFSGSPDRLALGIGLLLLGVFVARPYCRYLCPYGAVLGWFSRLSRWRIAVTPEGCTDCGICLDSCPLSAVDHPPPDRVKVRLPPLAVVALVLAFPLLGSTGWLIGHTLGGPLARMHPGVQLAEQVYLHQTGRVDASDDTIAAFHRAGGYDGATYTLARKTRRQFDRGAATVGAVLGLLLALRLLSATRNASAFEANRARCLQCGRCYGACPANRPARPPDRSHLARPAASTAAVAVLFLVAVTAILIVDPAGRVDLVGANPIDALKDDLARHPDDEGRLQALRDVDLQQREAFQQGRLRRRSAGWLLLAGGIALVGALRVHSAARRRAPRSPGRASLAARWPRDRRRVLAGLVVGAAVLFAAGGIAKIGSDDFMAGEGFRTALDQLASAQGGRMDEELPWARFRGPGGRGVAPTGDYPVNWDGTTGEAVLFATEIPLPGKGSPVAAGGRLFLTGATAERREVYAVDADTGALLWQRTVQPAFRVDEGEVWTMDLTGHAPSTPITDGHRVYAIFANGDVAAFDLDGHELWCHNLGTPDSAYGYATSLIRHDKLLLVQLDQGLAEDGRSQLLALDALTGQVIWRKPRPVDNSWSTPVVIEAAGRQQLLTTATPYLIAYDPGDGEEIWRAKVLRGDSAASPILAGGHVVVFVPGSQAIALRPDGSGDVTDTHVVWRTDGDFPELCSPTTDDRLLFTLTRGGHLLALDLTDGSILWDHHLPGPFSSSPSLVGSRLVVTNEAGRTWFLDAGPLYVELGTADLGEPVFASPVFFDGRIYLRGERRLFALSDGASDGVRP